MECTSSFLTLLSEFRCVFTQPSYQIFLCLMTGWVLSYRRRFVTELIWSSGSTHRGHHSRYHNFFAKSVWELDTLSWVLMKLLVAVFAPTGIILLAVDAGQLGARLGRRDAARRESLLGLDEGVEPAAGVSLVPQPPGPDQRQKEGETVLEGQEVPQTPARSQPSHPAGHVHPQGVLYEPALVAGPKPMGRPRKKGRRLPGMKAWANDPTQPWQTLVFDQFGLHATLRVKTRQALYYKAGKDRLLTIVLVHDVLGQRPDQMFYCTRLDWNARQILSTYALRWSIEVTFENGKQLLGLEDPANRKEKAVRRTAPMALVLYSLIVLWFHREGHRHLQFPDRPWYRRKCEPSFADLLTTLRRASWLERIRTLPWPSRLVEKYLAPLIEFLSLAG